MKILGSYPKTRLRRLRKSSWIRNLVSENNISHNDLVLPIFVREGKNIIEPINVGLYNKTVDLKKGTYGVKVLIDTNGNADIDLNFFGLPKEQFGFSNNVLGLFGAPKFIQASFELNKDKKIIINLR